jgi:dihydrofolate synthase/folylpolyglutamate synthase
MMSETDAQQLVVPGSLGTDWSLSEWLVKLERRYPQEIKLRLVNARQVAEQLSILKWSIPVITVAGTNGKGSTVAALSAIYQAAGYRVGQFTSPHLFRFNERICINNHPIDDVKLCQLFQYLDSERKDTALTFFEMAFLAALLYFKEAKLDVIILEVGMGGRLDATNIIDADLAIITTIDLDHQAFLGADKETIGKEKAGILRQYQPFIYADFTPPLSIIAQAQALETEMYTLGADYRYEIKGQQLILQHPFQIEPLRLPLPTLHPHAAAAAIMASLCLQTLLPVSERDWAMGMRSMSITGRQQWIKDNVNWIYDVAHNPQAVNALKSLLETHLPFQGKIHAVFSALKDKDICGLIKPLSTIVDYWYPACLTGQRASSQEQLLTAFHDALTMQPLCYSDPIQATQAALAAAKSEDIILVYGSFWLVGEIMRMNHLSYSTCHGLPETSI